MTNSYDRVDPKYDNAKSQGECAGSSSADRRVFQRVPFFRAVTIVVLPDVRAIDARTQDISLCGVGVSSMATFRNGQNVEVVFRLPDPKTEVREERVPGRVINIMADSDSNRVGIEFLKPLQESTFPALVRAVSRL